MLELGEGSYIHEEDIVSCWHFVAINVKYMFHRQDTVDIDHIWQECAQDGAEIYYTGGNK